MCDHQSPKINSVYFQSPKIRKPIVCKSRSKCIKCDTNLMNSQFYIAIYVQSYKGDYKASEASLNFSLQILRKYLSAFFSNHQIYGLHHQITKNKNKNHQSPKIKKWQSPISKNYPITKSPKIKMKITNLQK